MEGAYMDVKAEESSTDEEVDTENNDYVKRKNLKARPTLEKVDEIVSFFKSKSNKSFKTSIEDRLLSRIFFSSTNSNVNLLRRRRKKTEFQKNPGLSNTKKKKLGLFNIGKNELKFNDMLPLHELWTQYMIEYLGSSILQKHEIFVDPTDYRYELMSTLLWKADYHGAYIVVHKSTCPSLVGIQGILVFETKHMLKLLGKDNITRSVQKVACEFKIRFDVYEMSFVGKNFMIKPADRAVKKLKGSAKVLL